MLLQLSTILLLLIPAVNLPLLRIGLLTISNLLIISFGITALRKTKGIGFSIILSAVIMLSHYLFRILHWPGIGILSFLTIVPVLVFLIVLLTPKKKFHEPGILAYNAVDAFFLFTAMIVTE